jgi:hypothetical protein
VVSKDARILSSMEMIEDGQHEARVPKSLVLLTGKPAPKPNGDEGVKCNLESRYRSV